MLKNKKIWVGIILAIILIILGIQNNKTKLITENHLAYLNVNSIILKLDFSEKYEQTKKGIMVGQITTEVNDIDYLNDKTKENLTNLEFKGKSLEETINNVITILKENKVAYQNVVFYTDSKNSEVNLDDSDIVIKKYYQEELNEEEILESVSKVYYRVSFDSNGGSPIASVLVEEGLPLEKPEDPTRDGYTFTSWMLNDKEYDFKTLIKDNMVLKATWKKNETTNNNTSDKTSTNKNNNSNSSTNNKPSSSPVSSTIDKINLNDFISVAINYYRYSTPYAYMYPTNLSELAPEIGNKTDLVVVDDNAIDPHGNKVNDYDFTISEWKKNIFPNLKYDTAKEESVANGLNNLVNKKTKGVELTVSTEDHQYYYEYRYLTINNKDFSTLNNALTTLRNNLNKELSSVVSGGIYIDFLNAYGVYSSYYKTLDEDLCLEFNLVCDRW